MQTFWAPDSPIQITIVLLVEKIILAMGDELKIYLPPMVQPVLRLFMQDESEQKLVTQKVCTLIMGLFIIREHYMYIVHVYVFMYVHVHVQSWSIIDCPSNQIHLHVHVCFYSCSKN